MKTRFLLCMRPTVIETDDGDYIKLPSPITSSPSASGRSRFFHQPGKRVAPEKYIRQLSVKSNGYTSEGKPENRALKDSDEAPKITRSVSEACFRINDSDEESVRLKKPRNIIKNDKVNDVRGSNLGACIMVSCLFFTIFLGKFFGIMCMLTLVCLFNPHRKNDGNGGRKPKTEVANSPERGSVKAYNKKVIMDGLLERRSHYRENNKLFS